MKVWTKLSFIVVFIMTSAMFANERKESTFVRALRPSEVVKSDEFETSGSLITYPNGEKVTTGQLRVSAIKYAKKPKLVTDSELLELLSSELRHERFAAYSCLAARYPKEMKNSIYRPLLDLKSSRNTQEILRLKALLGLGIEREGS